MKILLVTAELSYRGTPRTLVNYARIFRKLGHDILVWGYREGGDSVDILQDAGFDVVIGPTMKDFARSFKPDVVSFHRPGLYISVEDNLLKDFKSWGAKTVETNVFGWADTQATGLIDVSLQISLWDLFMWRAWGGKSNPFGVYCPNPVDTDSFKRSSEGDIERKRIEWRVPKTARILGRIGKTSWNLLEKPLLKALNQDSNLYFVSVEDYNNPPPATITNHPRCRTQKRLHGAKELCDFYSSCNYCINMFKVGESFGFVNAEAMCCGTPVIALSTPLRCNAQAEMVSNKKGGVVIADADCLCDALKNIGRCQPNDIRNLIVSRYSFSTVEGILKEVLQYVRSGNVSRMLVTNVPKHEIERLYSDVMGRYTIGVKVLFRLLYTRVVYQAITLMRKFR